MKAGRALERHNFQEAKYRHNGVFSAISSFALGSLEVFLGKHIQLYSGVVGKCFSLYKSVLLPNFL